MPAGVAPGAYLPGSTPLHRLDPRVKLLLLVCWTLGLFAVASWWAYGALVCAVLVLARSAGVSVRSMARGLKPMVFVLVFVMSANALRLDGSGAVALVGQVGIAPEGALRGARAVVRIALMVALVLMVTATTSSSALMEALLWFLAPLRRAGLPVDDAATMLSIALRFVPVCSDQFERVATAQRARGARLGQGGLVTKVRSWLPVMVPLFMGLFRRSAALARAMAARCYGVGPRTSVSALRMRRFDAVVLVAGLALCLAAVWFL